MWCMFVIILTTFFHINTGEIAVLILARGGSKGVPLKNLRKVGGLSLLSRTIHTAKVAGFNDITVSTDHPLIALEAIHDNVTAFRRSPVTATDWAPSIWGAAEFLSFRSDVTILILMQATSPFTRPSYLKKAIKHMLVNSYDCVFSSTRYKLRWQTSHGKLIPINFNINARVRRQDWDGELLETGAFYIARRSLVEEGKFQNDNCTVVEVSVLESLEVDTEEDLQLANAILNANLV